MDGGDRLSKRTITVKTENKTKINYNKKKSQPKMITLSATLFHKSNTENQMVNNTGFYSAQI